MLPALFLTLAALAFTLFRLWACRAQLLDMARTLEETPAESSLRLTVRLESSAVRRLCCAVTGGRPGAGAEKISEGHGGPCGIDEVDLCVIFANALDNAIAACRSAAGERSIRIKIGRASCRERV